jgi:hypothetical protein
MKNKKYSRIKMLSLYLLSVGVNIMPLLIVIAFNWKACTKTIREGVALSVTGIFWVLFLVLTMMGAMPKKINRAVVLTMLFVVLELMKPLLNYMCLFAGAAAIGALLDVMIARPMIKRYAELRVATKTADMTTNQVVEAVKEMLQQERTGRV